ncbi:MAG: hypothetical protein KGN16_08255 [Burkholderiales bacterium]|nr:hypothetical protein [Burkholderiales bacterium]
MILRLPWAVRQRRSIVCDATRIDTGFPVHRARAPALSRPDFAAKVTHGLSNAAYHVDVGAEFHGMFVVPPGPSRIEALADGWVLRCFSARHADRLARAGNAADWVPPCPGVAPLLDWPAPPRWLSPARPALERPSEGR